jgi:ubiquitin carboxyl-terminal hydrolase L5
VAPQELWFANQVSRTRCGWCLVNVCVSLSSKTSSFSCATVALMNIINNRQDVHLGEQLDKFRSSTATLSSKDRGLALDGFDHVRNVHNSFAA